MKRMTTLEDTDAAPAASNVTHPEATAVEEAATAAAEAAISGGGELHPEVNTDSQVDPADTTSKRLQEEQDEVARKSNKDRIQSLKSAVIISGVVAAVIGAIFAVAKKVREGR